jgi:hypothetical protein
MVLVVRAWVEEGRPDGFRARLIQAAGPEVAAGPSEQIVTTSLEETILAIRAWLATLDAETEARSEETAPR